MRHSRDSNHGSPAFRASVLTFRLPWHTLTPSILAPYRLLSAFTFFKQQFYVNIQQQPKATHKVLNIEEIAISDGGLKVKTLARKARDPWFDSRP